VSAGEVVSPERAAFIAYHAAVKAFFKSITDESDNYVGGVERWLLEEAAERAESLLGGGESDLAGKQKWMVVFERDGEWHETDYMGDRKSEADQMLKLLRKNSPMDIDPDQWTEARSRVVPCTLLLQFPKKPGKANP